jgi:hypothetical protein
VQNPKKKVQNLPENTVILYYLLTRDGEGRGFPPWEVTSILAEAANAQVYGCLESYFGYGIVGGRLLSLEMLGGKAGLQISVSKIPDPQNNPGHLRAVP